MIRISTKCVPKVPFSEQPAFGSRRCVSNRLRYRFADVWTRCSTGVHSISLCICSCDKTFPSFTACARVYLQVCVRVRVGIGIQDVSPASSTRRSSCSSWPVASFPFPAYFPVFPLPFAFHSSLPSTSLRSFLYHPPSFMILDFFLRQHHVVIFRVPIRIMLRFHFCPRIWSPS